MYQLSAMTVATGEARVLPRLREEEKRLGNEFSRVVNSLSKAYNCVEDKLEIMRRAVGMAESFGNFGNDLDGQFDEVIRVALKMEKSRRPYTRRSPQVITHLRPLAVDYMWMVCEAEEYGQSTFSLGVYVYDSFTETHLILREKPEIYLISLVCLVLAAKMEEEDSKTPKFTQLMRHLPRHFSFRNVLKVCVEMERFILEALQCKLFVPTEITFLDLFMLFALDGFKASELRDDIFGVTYYKVLWEVYNMCRRVIKAVIFYGPTPGVNCSLIAAAIMMFARRECGLNVWTQKLVTVTHYPFSQVLACMKTVIEPICDEAPGFMSKHRFEPSFVCSS